MLRALRRLSDEDREFQLDVVGEDTLGGRVQALAEGLGIARRIRFHGFLTQRALRPIVEAAHVAVVSSRHEAGPLVVLEAAVAGVPTVGTAVGHIADWSPRASLAVPCADAGALARAIATLADHEDLRLEIAVAAQRIAIRDDADRNGASVRRDLSPDRGETRGARSCRMNDRPLVSIVMPTYDRLQFLPATVESIFAQTLRDWELIVADDGSGAPTLEYLAALERDARVRVLRRKHVGIPSTVRNAGISEARAPLVAFMDSDDVWPRAKLEKQLAEMHARPVCRWSYTGFVIVDADDVPFPSEADRPWTPYSGEIFEQVVRGTASIRTSSVIASTELLREIGGFDERIDCAEDCDLFARLALRSPACIVEEPLVRMRRHRPDSAGTIGASHAGREYSLRRLAAQQSGPRRAVLTEELGRNAWLHASVVVRHLGPRPALATLQAASASAGRRPRWWYGAAKAAARACLRRLPGGWPLDSGTAWRPALNRFRRNTPRAKW